MDIAIIGIAGKFPEANNLKSFYENLRQGKDSIRDISYKRKSNTTISLKEDYRILGFMEDIDLFDYEFFGLTLSEARCMDPHQRILLEVIYEAIESAGYSVDHFKDSNTSFFGGHSSLQYYKHAEEFDSTLPTGNSPSIIPGRIARFFALNGTGLLIDTGCSSSAVALHYACMDLSCNHSEYAIVTGAHLSLFPRQLANDLNKLGTSSSDGKSKSFSAESDGSGSGEAIACVLLKPLSKALEDRDIIQAVIKGTATNQDGARSGSLTAPSATAQSQLIKKAWKNAGIDPTTISYIEAHGTATKLGDPIEVQGITNAFNGITDKKQFCAISSAKSNIGHTDTAAGITGVAKAVLSLKNKELFPSVNFEKPNPLIEFEKSPVYVNTELRPWESNGNEPRRAGVSSFGMSGTNAHIVLEEAPKMERSTKGYGEGPVMITISATTGTALLRNMLAIHEFLQQKDVPTLEDIAYTLKVGRADYPYRYACVCNSIEHFDELLSKEIEAIQIKNLEASARTDLMVFLFSDSLIVNGEIIEAFSRFQEFNAAVDEFKYNGGLIEDSYPGHMAFCFQYAFYRLLKSLGIQTKTLIGSGMGQLIISVIVGKTDLREAIGSIETLETKATPPDIETRAKSLLDKLTGDKLIFLEMGAVGMIAKGLEAVKADSQRNFKTVALQESPTIDSFLLYLKELYTFGLIVDWEEFYRNSSFRRVELPTYQFDKTRCWLKPPTDPRRDWLYDIQWIPSEHSMRSQNVSNQTFLLFSDRSGLSKLLIKRLEEDNNKFIKVQDASEFEKTSDYDFTIDYTNEDHYERLKEALVERDDITGIIHLSSYSSNGNLEIANLDNSLEHDLYPLFFTSKAFADQLSKKKFSFTTVTSDAYQIEQNDNPNPINAASTAFMRGLLSQYPTLNVNSIDVESKCPHAQTVDNLIHSLSNEHEIKFVAYRKGIRYVSKFSPLQPATQFGDEVWALEENATYLITGGATGIGLEIAKSLAVTPHTNLIIVGRTELPPREMWDKIDEGASKSIRRRITDLLGLEDLGANVIYHATNIGNTMEMEGLIQWLKPKYNKIDMLIHCAGVVISRTELRDKSLEEFQATILPKIHGTILLDHLCDQFSCENFVGMSSLNSLVPKKNSMDYAAANAFMDTYVGQMAASKTRKYASISWPGWSEVSSATAISQPVKSNGQTEAKDTILELIKTEDGLAIFHQALNQGAPNFLVANVDLDRFKKNPFFTTQSSDQEMAIGTPNGVPLSNGFGRDLEQVSLEKQLLNIWYQVLGTKKIKSDSDFFEIGGNSLNAVNLINKVEERFDIRLEIEELFQLRTVDNLSTHLEHALQYSDGIEKVELHEEQDHYPLSHAQKQLWLVSLKSEASFFNLFQTYRIKGHLDVQLLDKVMNIIVKRHEALRTTFINVDGLPRQKILTTDKVIFSVGYDDFSNKSFTAGQEKIKEEMHVPFKLEMELPVRVKVYKTAEEDYVFSLTIHHICADHVSMMVLVQEMLTLYYSYGREQDLGEYLTYHYKDYAVWEKNQLTGESLEQLKKYWLNKFEGEVMPLELNTDYSRPAQRQYTGGNIIVPLGMDTFEQLSSLGQSNKTTLYNVLLAATYTLLHRYSNQEDIIIGTAFGGRFPREFESCIGDFINTLPIRLSVDGQQRFESLLNSVKATTLEAMEHRIYPFDLLVAELKLERQSGRSPVFDVMMDLTHNDSGNDAEETNLEVEIIRQDQIYSKYDLTFFFRTSADDMVLNIEYSTELFEATTIELLGQHFKNLLEDILNHPHKPINELTYFDEEDKISLLASFNDTEIDFGDR